MHSRELRGKASVHRLPLPVACFLYAVVGSSSSHGDPPIAEHVLSTEIIESFTVPRNANGFLLVPVTINGATVMGAIDTGASHSTFDSSLRHLLGAPLGVEQVHTYRGPAKLPLFAAPNLTIGRTLKATPRPAMAHCDDLSAMRRYSGQPVMLVIGMDVINGFVLRLDLSHGVVSFLRRPPRDLPAVRMQFPGKEPRLPWLEATLPGLGPMAFQIDTGLVGDCDGILRADVYKRALALGILAPSGVSNAQSILGNNDGAYARLKVPIEIGGPAPRGHSIYKTTFAEGHGDFSYLGTLFFAGCVATFDFPGAAVYFEPAIPPLQKEQPAMPPTPLRPRRGHRSKGLRNGG